MPPQAGAELTESERRATEIQAAFEREQLRPQASSLRALGGAGSAAGGQQSAPHSPGFRRQPSGGASDGGGDYAPGSREVPGASPAREERRRPSLPGQGDQQGSRSSSRNSSVTNTVQASGDPRRRTIRELVAASQVWRKVLLLAGMQPRYSLHTVFLNNTVRWRQRDDNGARTSPEPTTQSMRAAEPDLVTTCLN